MEVWQWIVTAAGGIVAIAGAASAMNRWTKPIREHTKRVETLEQQNKRDLERFDMISHQLTRAHEADQAVYQALISIMNHMIDGNSIEKLKAARSELSKHIIRSGE